MHIKQKRHNRCTIDNYLRYLCFSTRKNTTPSLLPSDTNYPPTKAPAPSSDAGGVSQLSEVLTYDRRGLVIERPNDVDVVSYAIALCFVGDCERAIGCTVWVLWRGPVGLGDALDGAVGRPQSKYTSALRLVCGTACCVEPLWCLLRLGIAMPPALARLSNLSTAAWQRPVPAGCPHSLVVLIVYDYITVALEGQAYALALGVG